ncbi:MAG: hypothetical protein IPM83_10465 [Ignavibacteria bacterium]|nr:hypothetical protein [Ignavibacteria bacterium]
MKKYIEQYRSFCLIAVVALVCFANTASAFSTSPDSLVTLKYQLDVGRTYTWRLVADQFIVNGRALRLSAMFHMDAIDSDIQGNTQVRIRVRSSDGDPRTNEIIDSVKAGMFPVGSRRTNKAGVYDAMVDQLGKIIAGQYTIDENTPPPVMSGIGATNQFDSERSIDIPAMMNMMMPTMTDGQDVKIGTMRLDTLYIPSMNQKISGSRGSMMADGSKGQTAMDTLYRTIALDSVLVKPSGQRICNMAVFVARHNANGTHSITETSVQRDKHTGLLELVIERGFNLKDNGDRVPAYVAVAVIETDLTRLTDNEGNEVLTPPSMTPGSFR